MSVPVLPVEVAEAFGCMGQRIPLHGGEGRSIRVGQCVFKPIENPERYSWSCELLTKVSQSGFRIPVPRSTKDGSFVFMGWGATSFEPGEHVQGRWEEKLELLRLFHKELQVIDLSPMPPSDDRWSKAHELAWQALPIPTQFHSKILQKIEEVFSHYQPLDRAREIIHSDFCGNILFHEALAPCVIDFSPAYGSTVYAEVIMTADAIAWGNAPLEMLNLLPMDEYYQQNTLRAINFRLIVSALFSPSNEKPFLAELGAFRPILNQVCEFD